jgi:RNA polymerase-binding transcription factor DksA
VRSKHFVASHLDLCISPTTLRGVAEEFNADLEQSEQLLDDVDRVLRALDAGNYGTCEACGEPIEAERLDTDPLVTTCVAHPQLSEQPSL